MALLKELASVCHLCVIPLGITLSNLVPAFARAMWAGTKAQQVGAALFIISRIIYLVSCGRFICYDQVDELRIKNILSYFWRGVFYYVWRLLWAIAPAVRLLLSVLLCVIMIPISWGFFVIQPEGIWYLLDHLKSIWYCPFPFPFEADEDRESEYYRSESIFINWFRVMLDVVGGSIAVGRYLHETGPDNYFWENHFLMVFLDNFLATVSGILMVSVDFRSTVAIITLSFYLFSLLFFCGCWLASRH